MIMSVFGCIHFEEGIIIELVMHTLIFTVLQSMKKGSVSN